MSTPIVVADDSSTIRTMIVVALKRDGHDPAIACDGAEALAQVRAVRPRLVILDAQMPNGDGYEVCREIRTDAELEQPYVLMLTGATREVDRLRAEEAGVDEVMTKPFSPAELRARVAALLV